MREGNMSDEQSSGKKLRTKDLIYGGAFAAIYLVVMLIIVMTSGMIPVLYYAAPLTVGVVTGTIYMLCVMKLRRFGGALIMGVLFGLVACGGRWYSLLMVVCAALLAELILFLGKYGSRKMYLLSFVASNFIMAAPYLTFVVDFQGSLDMSRSYYSAEHVAGLASVFAPGFYVGTLVFALAGGIAGALIANKLVSKHFEKAGVL